MFKVKTIQWGSLTLLSVLMLNACTTTAIQENKATTAKNIGSYPVSAVVEISDHKGYTVMTN